MLEQQEEIAKFSPTLGFVYSIDGRGQRGLRQHVDDALLDVLKAKCAAWVPLNPFHRSPPPLSNHSRHFIGACRSSSVIDMKVFNPDGTQGQNTIKGSTANFWIARHRFVQMLYDTVSHQSPLSRFAISPSKCACASPMHPLKPNASPIHLSGA